MNIFIINKKKYSYESYWRNSFKKKEFDSNKNLLPYPKSQSSEWTNKDIFLRKLNITEIFMRRHNKYTLYEKNNFKKCLICNQQNISKGIYQMSDIRWEDGLYHYIDKHNIEPSKQFIDFIFHLQITEKNQNKIIAVIPYKKKILKNNYQYLKLSKNQLLILDALFEHGSYTKKYFGKYNILKYSEHAGLLDFNNSGLEKIIITAKSNVKAKDSDIFMPNISNDSYDYEYIFHTHPATPKHGARINLGILYEIPSISDIFHFIDHYNNGLVQGSIVIAPEGLYNIGIKKSSSSHYKYNSQTIEKSIGINELREKIHINEDNLYKDLLKYIFLFQSQAIDKFKKISNNSELFYTIIAQDKTFIDDINNILNKYDLHIDYYPRKKINGVWILDEIYLYVSSVEYIE